MFICGACNQSSQANEPMRKIPVEIREMKYTRWDKDYRGEVPGGTGWEIAREVEACPRCTKEAEQKFVDKLAARVQAVAHDARF